MADKPVAAVDLLPMEHSKRRTTSSNPFDKFPNEILVHIFVKGIEDEQVGENHTTNYFRRLRSFARLARQVCVLWKTIIDYPPGGVSFWIARLLMDFRPPPFAECFATFRRRLLSSNGCNLYICIDLVGLPRKLRTPSGGISPSTTLAIEAMDAITPYHNQVTQLLIHVDAPATAIHLLKVIATHWTNASQLASVIIYDQSLICGGLDSGFNASLSNLPGYNPERSIQASSQMPLPHLRNLDDLQIPSGLFLDHGLLLPPNLQSLILDVPDDVSLLKLYNFLQTQGTSFKSLRLFRIRGRSYTKKTSSGTIEQEWAKKVATRSIGRFNPSLLRRVSLFGIFMQEVINFLGLFCHCPSLEDISLTSIHSSELSEDPIALSFPLEYPRLKTLRIQYFPSWQSLYHFLGMFISLPIERLELKVSSDINPPEWEQFDQLAKFPLILSKLHFRELILHSPYWIAPHIILAALDTQRLTTMEVELGGWLMSDQAPPQIPTGQETFVAPHLNELHLQGIRGRIGPFLWQLEAVQLATVYVTTWGDCTPEHCDREKIPQAAFTKSFSSVRAAILTFQSRDNSFKLLPQLANLFPNLHELRIHVQVQVDDPPPPQLARHSGWPILLVYFIEDLMPSFCDVLATTITGTFPHLRSMHVQCRGFKGLSVQSEMLDTAREETRIMLQETLDSRAKAGGSGVPLRMQLLQYNVPPKAEADMHTHYRPTLITFEAHVPSSL